MESEELKHTNHTFPQLPDEEPSVSAKIRYDDDDDDEKICIAGIHPSHTSTLVLT